MKLFLDANVLSTAAHNPKGKAALIIEIQPSTQWTLATSAYATEEARRNLEIKAPDAVERLDLLAERLEMVRHRPDVEYPAGLVEKDRPIFQAALGCGATHLLTGDMRHFGPFMGQPEQTCGVIIQTVASFLASFATDGPDARDR